MAGKSIYLTNTIAYDSAFDTYDGLELMSSTATFTLTGEVTGIVEGLQVVTMTWTLSTAAGGLVQQVTATTALASATPIALSTLTRLVLIAPPSTNTFPFRLSNSTSEIGIPTSSMLPCMLPTQPGSTVYLYTTGGTTVGGVRIIQY